MAKAEICPYDLLPVTKKASRSTMAKRRERSGKNVLAGCLLLAMIVVFVAILSPSGDDTEEGQPDPRREASEQPTIPPHVVLADEESDLPGKAQVVLQVLTVGQVEETELRQLLHLLYVAAKSRRGFQFQEAPTLIGVYAYQSEDHFKTERGQWIGMLIWHSPEENPKVTIRTDVLASMLEGPEERFGFSEDARRAIWRDLVLAEERAIRESDEEYPPDQLNTADAFKAYAGFLRRLQEKYASEVRQRHGITPEQDADISFEAYRKNWPWPVGNND